jgi:hypothetical protein
MQSNIRHDTTGGKLTRYRLQLVIKEKKVYCTMKSWGRKIPRPIRLQVIRAWLDGKSRDKIEQELGISTGAVSGIIEDLRKDDPQFDLLREVAVKLKNQN